MLNLLRFIIHTADVRIEFPVKPLKFLALLIEGETLRIRNRISLFPFS